MTKKVLIGIGAGLTLVAVGVFAYIKREAVKQITDDVYTRVRGKLGVGKSIDEAIAGK